jgi:L-lactate dehydrogenase complex protein LldE
MRVALMVPCYIDTFYPRVGIATLELLERLKVEVVYPDEQTCCGQPMANSGCSNEARATEEHFMTVFRGFDYIVTPSGSCTHHVRDKFTAVPDSAERRKISASNTTWSNSCTTSSRFANFHGPLSNTKLRSTRVARPSAGSTWLP